MKRIVFIGDSHTWGQGADKPDNVMYPSAQAGELRQMSFDPPSYVNLFRNYINGKYSSQSGEITKNKLGDVKIAGKLYDTPFISIYEGRISAKIKGSMFRIQLKCGSQGAKANIFIDGKILKEICTYDKSDNSNNYRIWEFFDFIDTAHDLTIENTGKGRLDLYRIDYYGGEYAVINSGVGSCDSGKYLKSYWENYVDRYQPYLVVIEGFSINDWRKNTQVERYMNYLKTMFVNVRSRGGKCILHTVSPIMGKQIYSGTEYIEYIKASANAARKAGVPIADTFKAFSSVIPENSSEEEIKSMLYEDEWHVNQLGHRIYFDGICQLLEKDNLL